MQQSLLEERGNGVLMAFNSTIHRYGTGRKGRDLLLLFSLKIWCSKFLLRRVTCVR